MKFSLAQILKYIRNFLFLFVNREFLIFLFFLALSGSLWLGITLNDTYDYDIVVPVKLVNVPKSVILTTELPDSIVVTVRDKGFAHVIYKYGSRIHTLKVNFASYVNKNDRNGIVSSTDISKMVSQMLFGTSKIVSVNPNKMEFDFNYGLSRCFHISLDGTIRTAHTYYLANVKFFPDVVTVYANESILDSIRTVLTEKIKIRNLSDTVYMTVNLAKIRGAKIVPSMVRVALYPDILTEASLDVPIKAINMPPGKILRTFPSHVKVTYTVGSNHYKEISPDDFIVTVDYNDISEHPSDKCHLTLKTVPSAVASARMDVSV